MPDSPELISAKLEIGHEIDFESEISFDDLKFKLNNTDAKKKEYV